MGWMWGGGGSHVFPAAHTICTIMAVSSPQLYIYVYTYALYSCVYYNQYWKVLRQTLTLIFQIFYFFIFLSNWVKGVCHEIFDLHFFHDLTPFGPLIKQAKVFSNSVSVSPRYSITKWSPWCAAHRWEKNIFCILHIFSFMIDVFTPKRIPPDCPFKGDKRRFRFHLRGVQFVSHRRDHLSGTLHTAEIISSVCSTPRRFEWLNTYIMKELLCNIKC